MGATGGMVGATGGLTLAIILGLDSSLSTLVSDTGTSVGSLPQNDKQYDCINNASLLFFLISEEIVITRVRNVAFSSTSLYHWSNAMR